MIEIEAVKKEYYSLTYQLSNPELVSDKEKFEELTKKKEFLEQIMEKEEELEESKHKIEENKTILKTEKDPELISLVEGDLNLLQEREKELEKEIDNLLTEIAGLSKNKGVGQLSNKKESNSIIVEIRAGTGGEEAALFGSDLFRMYSRFGRSQGWKQKVLDSRPTELGGLKEIIFELSGRKIFSKMKYEGGIHRVQRIPETEKGGRIHTSTASVAILAKPKKTEIKVKPEDLKIDVYKASGPGGQYVNKRETAVRITHLPSGLMVTSQNERNQLQNKENALKILEARLLEKKEEEEAERISGERKSQIKKAQRAEKIRTYNFPQDRVTDHRTKKSFHNLEKIMAGDLEPILKDLQKSAK
ncbi:MAG: peptide chain release factor 1 [Candidatus Nealsonbacteria bacterium CG03_land_8_20_14_0_80_36_12]|uniref:Peptide chain release factor 1 n=1 Tax=Candidatus Nealsonbacteria bacterium CG03_land_8_20_14_0_80_36_12 TaxID=1974701 RepID=A0A2M7BYB8_9BACT|nr:MAG: peptide chain release factor 1 [Candidatus Nealsonbacteria bacterium CG03_land_8_20_14_0_80_36_12]